MKRVVVIKGFTDKTLIGRHGAFREEGQEFECSPERFDELSKLGLVTDVKKESEETKERHV